MNIQNPQAVGISAARLRGLDEWLEAQVTKDRFAGCSLLLSRHGQIAYFNTTGYAEVETKKPFQEDTVVRLHSMTKPVTTVAAMMLYEQNAFQLDDPIYRFIPSFRQMQVWQGGGINNTKRAENPITVRHLMTHTSGLTYGFMQANAVDELYRERDITTVANAAKLADWAEQVATVPLLFEPGTRWSYSIAVDLLGRLVEIWSGESLADFFENRIFKPLGMTDTGFHVAEAAYGRLAALYSPPSGPSLRVIARKAANEEERTGGLILQDAASGSRRLKPARFFSGGGGLTGTITDYARFCRMLLNRGELEGSRILGRKTVEYMMRNHLPDNNDIARMNQAAWLETTLEGIGFGLGGAVVLDPVKAHSITSEGEFYWGGAASTLFWIDPIEDLYVVFLTQLMPSSTYPIRRELRTRVYQTLID